MPAAQMQICIHEDQWNERIDNLWQNTVANTAANPRPIKTSCQRAERADAEAPIRHHLETSHVDLTAANVRVALIVRRHGNSPPMTHQPSVRGA